MVSRDRDDENRAFKLEHLPQTENVRLMYQVLLVLNEPRLP